MAKKFLKSLSVGLIVFFIAILCGYISYTITLKYQKELLDDIAGKDNVAATSSQTVTLKDGETVMADYYVARLEEDKIAVYVSVNQKEAFLYSMDIYETDFPKEDIEKLRNGIIFNTRQELTSFEEDFTS